MHNLFQQAGFFFYDRINNPITCNYCWNEALDRDGFDFFQKQALLCFGKTQLSELTGTQFICKRMIRCRPSRHGLMIWRPVAILKIDYKKLQQCQWCCGGSAGDRFVLGAAAIEYGKIWEVEVKAYELWELRGRPIGEDWVDWRQTLQMQEAAVKTGSVDPL